MNKNVYSGTRLRDEITIRELVTVHYFELSKDYRFTGERHDFWELVYVDNGEITAYCDELVFELKSGDIIFHKPNEWHTVATNGIAASIVVISFKCTSAAMMRLEGKMLKTGSTQRTLLSKIVSETTSAFDSPLSDLVTPKLHRRKDGAFGAEQLIRIHLTELLLTLMRNDSSPVASTLKRNLDSGLFGEIVEYLAQSIGQKLTLDDISRHAGISKTAVKKLFREQAGCGACEYFVRMKINRAKAYIREDNYNFTQISEMLGYDSIHYFSRQFHKYVNMSPTEYAGSIRALTREAAEFGPIRMNSKENDV